MDNGDIDQNPGGHWAGEGQDDPRPVFEGDWQSATGVEKGKHSERIRQWKLRQGIGAGKGAVEPSKAPARHDEDLATLDAIIAAPKSLASDKIRAVEAKQRILARKEEEAREDEYGPLIQLRDALDLVPAEQRVEALRSLVVVVGEGEGVEDRVHARRDVAASPVAPSPVDPPPTPAQG